MTDSKRKSWAKAITWAILGFIILLGLTVLFVGDLGTGFFVSIGFNLVRIPLYFWHERVWTNSESLDTR